MSKRTRRPRASATTATRSPSKKTWTAVVAAVMGLLALIVPNVTGSDSSSAGPTTTIATGPGASNRTDPSLRSIGFRTPRKLADHYAKHGREFGDITRSQYLAMAQDLRDARLSKTVIETTQNGGSISRLNRSTGAFIAFDPDLTIRTFFKPNDGEDYFWRAAKTRR